MTYDWWVGRRGAPLRRDALHAAGDLPVVADELPLRRRPRARPASRRGGACRRSGRSRHWNNHIELLAMVEDTNDGAFYAPPPRGGAHAAERGPGHDRPVHLPAVRAVDPRCGRRPTRRCGRSPSAAASARFMQLTETQGVYARTRSAAAGWRTTPDLGVVDADGARLRLRGPVLHRLVDHPDVARREPVADDRGRGRARRRGARGDTRGDLGLPRGRRHCARRCRRRRSARACIPAGSLRRAGRLAQLVRAPRLHRGGRWFEPSSAHAGTSGRAGGSRTTSQS